MDQIKIGQFIKEVRKAKGLTQEELADKLLISHKTVSKWECGNGMPDVSLMIPLCEVLEINANELLSGEHIADKDYMEKAEKNLLELKKANERRKKKLRVAEFLMIAIAVVVFLSLCIVSVFVSETWLRVTLMGIGFVCLLFTSIAAIPIEKEACSYECPCCGEKIDLTYKIMFTSMHSGWTRYIKCPKCGKRNWMKCKRED